jgi:hypothetical protein
MPASARSGDIISLALSVLMTQFACDTWSLIVDFDPAIVQYMDDATFNPAYYSPTVATSNTRVSAFTLGNSNNAATNGNQEIVLGTINFRVLDGVPPGDYNNVISACATSILGRSMITMGTNIRFDFGNGVYLAPLKIV